MAVMDPTTDSTTNPTLRALLAEGRVPLARTLELGLALADTLRSCLDRDTLPRALPPDEIIVDRDGSLVIRTGSGTDCVPPDTPYAGPEVIEGEPPGERSAVWQLGVLLYESLAGFPPFAASSPKGHHTPIPSLRSANPEVTELLESAIYRMLDTDPDLRLASLQEARSRLEDCLRAQEPSSKTHGASSPIRSHGHSRSGVAQSLSVPSTPFIGRRAELAAISQSLRNPDCRILTLVGPGGVGKSRLAFEAAQEVAGLFRDGVCIVPLNPVAAAAFIPLAIGSALGFQFAGRQDPIDQLIGFLKGRSLLLVLDDFDRLLDGAGLVWTLIAQTPGVKALVTSRQRLDLRHETVMPVPGLQVPPDDPGADLLSYEAVRLYMEHAQRICSSQEWAESDLQSVVRVCRRVDGSPLAIEMAAGWLRVLTSAEILAEIERDIGILRTSARDMPDHHKSMVAVLSQSWQRLKDHERTVATRLSVFGHGFRREAAEYLGADLRFLRSLIDRSVLSRDSTGRYHLHELFRQFLEEQLSQDGEAHRGARKGHTDFFAGFARERLHLLRSRHTERSLEEMEEELANLRLALDWALCHLMPDEVEACLRSLHALFEARGWLSAGNDMVGAVVQRLRAGLASGTSETHGIRRALGVVLGMQGDTHQAMGRYGSARALYEEGLVILREWGDHVAVATALVGLGDTAGREGHYEEAEGLLDEAGRLATDGANPLLLAQCCNALGSIAMYRGEYGKAQESHERCLSLLGESGDRRMLAIALNNLGNASYCLGDLARAGHYYEEALRVNREIGRKRGIRTALSNLGNVAIARDDSASAREFYNESLNAARELGDDHGIAHALYQIGMAESGAGNFAEGKRLFLESIEMHRKSGERRGLGLALSGLAAACAGLGDHDTARSTAEESVSIFRELGERWGLTNALRVWGDSLRDSGQIRRAIEVYLDGLYIAGEIGSRGFAPQLVVRIARCVLEQGDRENAAMLYAFVSTSDDARPGALSEATTALERLEQEMEAAALEDARIRAGSLTLQSLRDVIDTGGGTASAPTDPTAP